MKLTDTLYDDVKYIWRGYLEKPFVKELGDGSLMVEKFIFYMLQDYVYLKDYVKVFALGLTKSKTIHQMQYFSDLIHSTLNGEMDLHRAYLKRLGFHEELPEMIHQTIDNVAYTHYMLEIGHNEGLLELLVSMLACSWSYAYIAAELAKIPGASTHPFYGEWIQGYTSEEYIASNEKIMDMINELGANCNEEQLKHLKDIFKNCSKFEDRFWDMCYNI